MFTRAATPTVVLAQDYDDGETWRSPAQQIWDLVCSYFGSAAASGAMRRRRRLVSLYEASDVAKGLSNRVHGKCQRPGLLIITGCRASVYHIRSPNLRMQLVAWPRIYPGRSYSLSLQWTT